MPPNLPGTMTPTRYQTALATMRISQRELARMLKCSTRLTADWGIGKQDVPPGIVFWLEECIAIHKANPYPPVPREWRRRDPRFSQKRERLREEARIAANNVALLRTQKAERRRAARLALKSKIKGAGDEDELETTGAPDPGAGMGGGI